MSAVADAPASAADGRAAVYAFKDDPYSSHARILEFAGSGGGRRALDVGAADGFLAGRLAARGWRVTALEQDPGMAARARGRCEEVVTCDLNRELPRLDGPFDLIVYGDVLEHLLAPEPVMAALNQRLGAEGRVIISLPNIAHVWARLMLLCGRFDYADRGILDRTHLHFFTWKSARALLARQGIEVMRMHPTPVPLPSVVPERFHGAALRAVHRLSAWASRQWPEGLGYQFVILGRKCP